MSVSAFSSSDNGAIHLHILRKMGYEEKESGYCGQLYRGLTANVTNLTQYFEFVKCTRRNLVPSRMDTVSDGSGLSFRLLAKQTAWVVDWMMEESKREEFGAVFHHGIKLSRDEEETAEAIKTYKTYGLNVTFFSKTIPLYNISLGGVLCGGHYAVDCSFCPRNNITGAWVGKNWCNGQCEWKQGNCVLIEE